MRPVVIYGAGGLGSQVHDILLQAGRDQVVGFLDSDAARAGATFDGVPILGGLDCIAELLARGVRHAVVAIGQNAERVRVAQELRLRGIQLVSAIHPLTSLARSATFATHLIIGPRATVCVNATVCSHAVLSAGTICDHDSHIGPGAFLHVAARLAGGVMVDALATLGVGAAVIPGRRVGAGATVDPGAVVIRDVPDCGHVSGVPAREISIREPFERET